MLAGKTKAEATWESATVRSPPFRAFVYFSLDELSGAVDMEERDVIQL